MQYTFPTTIYLVAAAAFSHPAWSEASSSDDAQRARFEHVDTNRDGSISRQEFRDMRNSRFGDFDVDESGSLSSEEFGVAVKGTPAHRFRGMAFRRADQDGDDVISQAEWESMPLRAFDRLDANENGALDHAEFQP